MRLSVAICTYNGAKYIGKQLGSILAQELPVNEIVLCDDGSTDDTIAIAQALADAHPEVDWQIEVNKPNLGVCANFDKAIRRCTGDVIFFSDQDDIWRPNKTRAICQYFNDLPNKEVLFTNADLIDGDDKLLPTDRDLFTCVGLTPKALHYMDIGCSLEIFQRGSRATGATMAIRRTFVEKMFIDLTASTKNDRPLHDELICFKAIELDCLGYITEPLISYRIHGSQECGLGELVFGELKVKDDALSVYDAWQNRRIVPYFGGAMVERCLFRNEREKLIESVGGVLRNMGRYRRIYRQNWWMFFSHDVKAAILHKKAR